MESLNGINALTLIFVALLLFAIAYRIYGLFMANRVLKLNNKYSTLQMNLQMDMIIFRQIEMYYLVIILLLLLRLGLLWDQYSLRNLVIFLEPYGF